MTHIFLRIYDWLKTRKALAIALLSLLILVSVVFFLRLNYQENIAEFLPKNQRYTSVYEQLGGQSKICIIFASDSLNQDRIVEAVDAFGATIEEQDTQHWAHQLQLHFDDSQMLQVLEFVQNNYPYFLTEEDYSRMDSLLAIPGYVTSQIQNNRQTLMLPIGGVMVHNIQSDPLHLFSPILKGLQGFKTSDAFEIYEDCLFSAQEKKGLVFLTSPFGMSESAKNDSLGQMLDQAMALTMSEYPDIRITAIGAPLVAVSNANRIKQDSILSITISAILIVVLLLLAFRRLGDLLWIIASLTVGWIVSLGCFAAFNDSISIIVLGLGSVIIGIAVNYPLHFLDHLKHERNSRQALKEMIHPLLIGNITTVSAFFSLFFLNSNAMSDLGLFGSLFLVFTILFVLVFMPLFVKVRQKECSAGLPFNLPSIPLRIQGMPWIIWGLTALFGWLSLQTSFDGNMQHINYMTEQQQDDMSLLTSSLQSQEQESVYAVAEGKDMQDALRRNETLYRHIAAMQSDSMVAGVSGIMNYMPSTAMQQERLARWQAFWSADAHKAIVDSVRQSCLALGFSERAFQPFYQMLSQDYAVREPEYFLEGLDMLLSPYLLHGEGQQILLVSILKTPKNHVQEVKNTLNSTLQTGDFVFDSKDVSVQLVSILSDDFNYIGYVCGFIVFFFLWLSFGRLELSLLSFLPLAVSWIWILGIMELFGIQFNIVNIILATFIFGQGDDYTIFITEGLMYEYAYNKKMLASYKKSVFLSALIMFVGIGTLIFAQHPAMKSLAEVTIIGMFTVVVMAYYLPPLVFRWLTMNKGQKREVPITMKRLSRSVMAFSFFLLNVLWLLPFTVLYCSFGPLTEHKKMKIHRLLNYLFRYVIYHVPGTRFIFNNAANETFEKPALIISNHQSHLDLACIMMLTPKVVVLTNDWVWNNPFYGKIIKCAEFYPVSDGIDANLERIKSLTERGYSVVVYPEGTRSADCSILRFHRGAFYIAQQLHLDILPIFIHGFGHVLSKKEFMLRKGTMYAEIQPRISADDLSYGAGFVKRTKVFNRYYETHYAEICRDRENVDYYQSYVEHKYLYKGLSVEKHCKKVMQHISQWKNHVEASYDGITRVNIFHSGQGEFAWLFALVHKDIDVYAFESDEEQAALAQNCASIPTNLHFVHYTAPLDSNEDTSAEKDLVLDMNETSNTIYKANHPQYIQTI